METFKLSAERRTAGGKGPASRLRREGKIPAVAYGSDLAATPVAVSPKELRAILKSDYGSNSVIELTVDKDKPVTCMVQEFVTHPVTRELIHADFKQVAFGTPIDVKVPCVYTGKSKGVTLGGSLQQIFRELPIRAVPSKIPSKITIDVTELDVEQTFKAAQLQLPEGVEVRLPPQKTIAIVNAPKKKAGDEKGDEAAEA